MPNNRLSRRVIWLGSIALAGSVLAGIAGPVPQASAQSISLNFSFG